MNKLKLATHAVAKTLQQNSPAILTGISVAGLISTTVMAVRATPKAYAILEDEGYFDQQIGKKEAIQLTWRLYAPAVCMGALTIGCMIGASSISMRRYAALASLYSISETTLREYQEKVVETIGASKEQKVRDGLAKDKLLAASDMHGREVIMTGKGEVLCFETITGRYFTSSIETIRKAENDLNHALIGDMNVSLNEVFYALGLPGTKLGDDMGWTVENMVEFIFSSQLTDNGTPCLVLDYKRLPTTEYRWG